MKRPTEYLFMVTGVGYILNKSKTIERIKPQEILIYDFKERFHFVMMVEVHVEQGWLEGEVLQLVTGDGEYYSFKGIPYAAPPVGDLRFKEPMPPQKWDGVRKATTHGSASCQKIDMFTGAVPNDMSEDCLFLNIYSPNTCPISPLPVMVFIHGGGFVGGSGNSDVYGPDFLVKNNVILVTINYRLGVLGFLCLDIPEAPGNAGLKDQVAALKWVQNNIPAFGGDVNNVTLFGDSIGSACVGLHILSPISRNLFQRAIIMSDTPFWDALLAFHPQRRAFALGKQLGCPTQDPHELLDFLIKVPSGKLLDSEVCIIASESIMNIPLKMFHFVAVVEKDFGQNAFLLEDPMKILMTGDINVKNVLLGYTADEAITILGLGENYIKSNYEKYIEMFVPRRIVYNESPNTVISIAEKITRHYFGGTMDKIPTTEFIKYLSDISFKYHIHKLIHMLHKSAECFLYKFSAYTERNIFGNQEEHGMTGAAHFDDLMYLFHGKTFDLLVSKEMKSYKIIKQICALFTNFAKHGNPTPDSSLGVTWPPFDNENKGFLDIGEDLVLGKAAEEDVLEFWDKIFEMAGGYYACDNGTH